MGISRPAGCHGLSTIFLLREFAYHDICSFRVSSFKNKIRLLSRVTFLGFVLAVQTTLEKTHCYVWPHSKILTQNIHGTGTDMHILHRYVIISGESKKSDKVVYKLKDPGNILVPDHGRLTNDQTHSLEYVYFLVVNTIRTLYRSRFRSFNAAPTHERSRSCISHMFRQLADRNRNRTVKVNRSRPTDCSSSFSILWRKYLHVSLRLWRLHS